MVGLDVTYDVMMDRAYIGELAASDAQYARLIARVVPHYQAFHTGAYNTNGSLHTHDPTAIAYLIRPDLFKTINACVRVNTTGYGTGQIIVDRTGKWFDGVETTICTEVDVPGVLELFKSARHRVGVFHETPNAFNTTLHATEHDRMLILLTNDDGYQAAGLRALHRELNSEYEAMVVAPLRQRSWIGKALTNSVPLTVATERVDGAAYHVVTDGTPADCTNLGLYHLSPRHTGPCHFGD